MTPYCISVNNAHNIRAFNFRTAYTIQKYFNNENVVIYVSLRPWVARRSHLHCTFLLNCTVNPMHTRPLIHIRNWFKQIMLGVNTLNPDSNPHLDVD